MPINKNGRTILLVEEDIEVSEYLETALKCEGYSVEVAQDGEEVLAFVQNNKVPISAILLDAGMLHRDGWETLKQVRRFDKNISVVVVSPVSSPLSISEAMNNGANHFIAKPINPEELRRVLKTAVECVPQSAAIQPERANAADQKQMFFGSAPYMRELQGRVRQIGLSEAPVLIRGETGVGKEVLARALHAQSPRAKKPLLKLNCVALPSELVESELFGYERGAFTGAFQKKLGLFELADGGTVLLDEIGDMDFKLQAKLLQVLQDHEFQRLGGRETVRVDIRIIAATHRDLEKAITENTFREDLFYRLSVVNIHMPALRERKDDLLAIAGFLVKKHTPAGTPVVQIPLSLQQVFLDYNWPGNIRELENIIRNFLIFRDADLIARELYGKMERNSQRSTKPFENTSFAGYSPVPDAVMPVSVDLFGTQNAASILEQVSKTKQDAERAAICAALKSTNWNRKQAALLLNIDYKALLYKMKKLSIKKDKIVLQPKKVLPVLFQAAAAGSAASPFPAG